MNFFRQFLKVEHAEQIFAAQLEKILAGRVPGLEAVDLLGSLMTICGRPTDDDLSRLFASLPDHPDAVLPVLKVLCRQQDQLVKQFFNLSFKVIMLGEPLIFTFLFTFFRPCSA